jgi:hypothetical protein
MSKEKVIESRQDHKDLTLNAFEHLNLLFKGLKLLVANFDALTNCSKKELVKLMDKQPLPQKQIELWVKRWMNYWITLRDEFSLVYDGVILNDCQLPDNEDFILERRRQEKDNLRPYRDKLILSSVEGFRNWYLDNSSKVCVFVSSCLFTLSKQFPHHRLLIGSSALASRQLLVKLMMWRSRLEIFMNLL